MGEREHAPRRHISIHGTSAGWRRSGNRHDLEGRLWLCFSPPSTPCGAATGWSRSRRSQPAFALLRERDRAGVSFGKSAVHPVVCSCRHTLGVADDEAGVRLFDGPGRREAALRHSPRGLRHAAGCPAPASSKDRFSNPGSGGVTITGIGRCAAPDVPWGQSRRVRPSPRNVPNAYEAAPNACTGATSTSYQTAHLPHSTGRPSPFAAIHSCTGRQKVTVLAIGSAAASGIRRPVALPRVGEPI